MKYSKRTGLKTYFFIFFIMTTGNILSLFSHDTPLYTYYHIMMNFHPLTVVSYHLSIARACFTALALIPLFLYAFEFPQRGQWFFRPIFLGRFVGDILGHNYEWQFLTSSLISEPLIGWVNLSLFVLILAPSYRAHYIYAFRRIS